MLRRLLVLSLLALTLLPAGCMTNRPYLWSWPHNKRKILTVLDDFHRVHMEIDRIVFDMDDRPLEDVD